MTGRAYAHAGSLALSALHSSRGSTTQQAQRRAPAQFQTMCSIWMRGMRSDEALAGLYAGSKLTTVSCASLHWVYDTGASASLECVQMWQRQGYPRPPAAAPTSGGRP